MVRRPVLLCLFAIASAAAAEGDAAPKPTAEPYIFDHLSKDRLFLKIYGSDEAVRVDDHTTVTLDGKTATLADLHKGDHIEHLLAENGLATALTVTRPAADKPAK
jgi:hypothetical protein